MTMYYIKNLEKGYWLPGGFGYTNDRKLAGEFSVARLAEFNLDDCTLEKCAPSLAAKINKAAGRCQICRGRGLNEVVASPSHLMDVKCERCNGTGKKQEVA